MPQLNPNPWFLMMLTSWLIFVLVIQPKLLSFISTNPPTNNMPMGLKTVPWTWPWT